MKRKRYYNDFKRIRGQWDARVRWDDGTTEQLPVAHQYFWRSGANYYDPLDWGPTPEDGPRRALAYPKMQRWVELARRTKKVLLQIDAVNDKPAGIIPGLGAQLEKAPEEPFFKAMGYVGVYDIDDVKFDLDGLRFKFLSRYEKVKL